MNTNDLNTTIALVALTEIRALLGSLIDAPSLADLNGHHAAGAALMRYLEDVSDEPETEDAWLTSLTSAEVSDLHAFAISPAPAEFAVGLAGEEVDDPSVDWEIRDGVAIRPSDGGRFSVESVRTSVGYQLYKQLGGDGAACVAVAKRVRIRITRAWGDLNDERPGGVVETSLDGAPWVSEGGYILSGGL